MKSLLIKILVIVVLVACFGGGVWKTIDYIEDRIIETTINLVENSEFVDELREMISEIVTEAIQDMIAQGLDVPTSDGVAPADP